MTHATLEQLVPGLAEQQARERLNRGLAFAGLVGFTHTLCGVEVRPLTPKHRLSLQLMRNAFTVHGVAPLEGDVFAFLWLLSPDYRMPGPGNRMACAWKQWRLRRKVKRLVMPTAIRAVKNYLVDQLQDSPESSGEGTDYSAWIHWMSSEASFWLEIHGGFTLETYLNTPYLVLQQLRRMWRVNHPDISRDKDGNISVEEPQFVNQSDRIVGDFHRDRAAAVGEIIRNQRERLP